METTEQREASTTREALRAALRETNDKIGVALRRQDAEAGQDLRQARDAVTEARDSLAHAGRHLGTLIDRQ